jgi:protein-L-isoaspartate O-methyltransferase
LTEYRGSEGTRPYAGAAWYYAEDRQRVNPEFMACLAGHLGWTRSSRVLDLGAGPGQLALLAAPLVAEVVALEPEGDMVAEGVVRARAARVGNVRFVTGGSDDLARLAPSLGRFRTTLMG